MAEKKDDRPKVLSAEDKEKAVAKAEDRAAKAEYEPKTAQRVAETVGAVQTDREKEKAAEAGVTDAAYIDYEKALENYENRDDIEPLAQRRAREAGTSFHDAKFRRQVGGVDHAGLATTDQGDNSEAVEDGPTD